jgi:hypothetical protein
MTGKITQSGKAGKPDASSRQRGRLPLHVADSALLVIIVSAVLLTGCGRSPAGDSSPTPVAGRPALAVDQEKINFGKVPLDKPVKAVFRLRNAGDQPLQILNQPAVEVKQGC